MITNNTAASRYEQDVNGHIVFAAYRREGGTLTITHVEAPPELRLCGSMAGAA